jgi:hypothetical protein
LIAALVHQLPCSNKVRGVRRRLMLFFRERKKEKVVIGVVRV